MNYDLLLHVDTDASALSMAIKNASNYVNAIESEKYTIAIVVNGKAVAWLLRTTCPTPEILSKLCSGNVRLYVCNNAIREHGINPEDLIPEAIVVPAGIVHIVKLQREGFAYVKP
jgi:hypothetical protein